MKKKITKIVAALLCMTLFTLALASCNNDKKETTSAPSTEEKGIWLPFVEN